MIRTKRLAGLVTSCSLLALLAIVWWQRWNIYDSWRLRSYEPSSQIAQLATDTTMNDHGRRMFYVYHPELDDREKFNTNCPNSERTIVLGCYVSRVGIYLYNVTDPRLDGVLQVTAAHEMLHGAYERLDSSEKSRMDSLLNQAFAEVTDQRIKDNIDDYRRNGADVTNELHSILGTEVRNLPSGLEQYYKRYFTDRLKIVEFSEKYEQVFTDRKHQVEDADKRLEALRQQIEDEQNNLQAQKQQLDSERARLDGLMAAKQYEAYNQGVPGFNAQVNAYNRQARSIGQLIDSYNALVAERNAIALEENELVKAIDSRPSTIEGQ